MFNKVFKIQKKILRNKQGVHRYNHLVTVYLVLHSLNSVGVHKVVQIKPDWLFVFALSSNLNCFIIVIIFPLQSNWMFF